MILASKILFPIDRYASRVMQSQYTKVPVANSIHVCHYSRLRSGSLLRFVTLHKLSLGSIPIPRERPAIPYESYQPRIGQGLVAGPGRVTR